MILRASSDEREDEGQQEKQEDELRKGDPAGEGEDDQDQDQEPEHASLPPISATTFVDTGIPGREEGETVLAGPPVFRCLQGTSDGNG